MAASADTDGGTGGLAISETPPVPILQTEYGQTSSFVLRDGSRVTLNANSTLWVPRLGFDTGTREVQLEGEAEFSVRHTLDNRRFVVKTSDIFQVEVLGTEFTVYARPRGTKVALTQGKIRLDYTQGTDKKQLMMKPGERATMDQKGDLTVEASENPEAESAWKEQRFVFNNTSVQEICNLLQESFGLVVRTERPRNRGPNHHRQLQSPNRRRPARCNQRSIESRNQKREENFATPKS